MSTTWQPKIVVFLCEWSLKSETIWQQRFSVPVGVRIVEVPCSGRVNPLLVMSTLQHGADGVLLVGCEPGHCHYKEGNYLGRRKFATLESFLQYLGLEGERVQVVFLNETDSGKFGCLIQDMRDKVCALGPAKVLAARRAMPGRVPAQQE